MHVALLIIYFMNGIQPAQFTYFSPAHEANIRGRGKTVHVVYISVQKTAIERGGGGRSNASPPPPPHPISS